MNFAEKLIAAGYKPITWSRSKEWAHDPSFDPKYSWYGLTTYHPEVDLVKEDIVVTLSLQSFACSQTNMGRAFTVQEFDLLQARSAKGIFIKKANEILYSTISGIPPPEEIINEIL
jgi:hypothetical protein